MADFIEQYHERVRKRLGRHEPQRVLELAEALCFPSFHPETLLRAAPGPDGSTLRLVTLTGNLWYSQAPDPTRFQEAAAVPNEIAEEFWNGIRDLDPPTIKVEHQLGCDGMTIEATYAHGDTSTSFKAWCPSPESPSGMFIGVRLPTTYHGVGGYGPCQTTS